MPHVHMNFLIQDFSIHTKIYAVSELYEFTIRIINGQTDKRYYSEPDFLNNSRRCFEEDIKRRFDVETGLAILEKLVDAQDILWLNLLDKLSVCASEDERVIQYLQIVREYWFAIIMILIETTYKLT